MANADDIIVNVTQLDKNHDTFGSLLMELLKSHSGNTTTCNNDRGITPDSLGTLSLDQIKDIEASSPAYYETIQHVTKMKSNTELSSPVNYYILVGEGLKTNIAYQIVSSNIG